jgi:hypothetical protein
MKKYLSEGALGIIHHIHVILMLRRPAKAAQKHSLYFCEKWSGRCPFCVVATAAPSRRIKLQTCLLITNKN